MDQGKSECPTAAPLRSAATKLIDKQPSSTSHTSARLDRGGRPSASAFASTLKIAGRRADAKATAEGLANTVLLEDIFASINQGHPLRFRPCHPSSQTSSASPVCLSL